MGDVEVSLAAGEATAQYVERLTSAVGFSRLKKGADYGVDVGNAAQGRPREAGCC